MPERTLQLDSPFLADVMALRLLEPIGSVGQSWLILADRLQKLRTEIDEEVGARSTLFIRHQLVVLAAVAWRTAHDLKIESREAAVSQDIPF